MHRVREGQTAAKLYARKACVNAFLSLLISSVNRAEHMADITPVQWRALHIPTQVTSSRRPTTVESMCFLVI